jgi:HEAT repeat protein
MSKRAKILGLALAAFILGLALVVAARGAEPKYRGRTLTSWLQQYSDTPLMETQRLAEAQEAIRAIGAQKALPTVLRLVKTRENPVSTWITEKAEKYRVRSLHWRSAMERQLDGIAGFEVLGTNCAPAVGELTKLLDDKELAFVAARCLENVGKTAEESLCECLTNADCQVRHLSVSALAAVTDDVEVYIGRIKPRLTDPEPVVRFATVQAIAGQSEAPELAVPLLISALGDSDDHVFSQAAEGLIGFGTNALSAFSVLTNAVANGSEGQKRPALKALAGLTPGAALPMLSNAVVTGSAQTMGAALQDMKPIAPQLALKMTLAEFHSTDAQRRSVAMGVARKYDVRTPGIAEALKSAALSEDPELARLAMATMRQMLRKEKEKLGAVVELPNEPGYQGKPLGQWLSMRREGWELDTNAVRALQTMGTNVIPALLARLTYKDPVFKLDDFDVSMSGATALIAMREGAKPALPELTALMDTDNGDLTLRVMIATLGMGVDAMPCLICGLTNRFPIVRSEAAHFLTEWGAQYPEERKRAVPYMVKLLSDPERDVRVSMTNYLKEIDPRAAAKAGVK